MGTYLSTPASEKYKEWGEDLSCPVAPLRFAVVDMQGWRKSMEDAHIVETTVPYPPGLPYLSDKTKIPKAKVFGVFDGHGGAEVARFCQLYLVSVLTKQKIWQEKPSSEETAQDGIPPISPDESDLPPEQTLIGQALIESFHALDRMIDDPSRRDEIIRLRTHKLPPTERRDVGSIPPIRPIGSAKVAEISGGTESALPPPPPPPPPTETTESTASEDMSADSDTNDAGETPQDEPSSELEKHGIIAFEEDTESYKTVSSEGNQTKLTAMSVDESTLNEEPAKEDREDAKNGNSDSEDDYDSDEAVGKEEAAREQGLDEDEESNDDVQINPYDEAVQVVESDNPEPEVIVPANKVTVMFQRLLSNMNENQSGQVVIRVAGEGNPAPGTDPADPSPLHAGTSAPSILQNGRMICNLPDHPIHAGCTAIVAVLLGRTLTIANAGDSRGVLCREGGIAEALSFDHKPQQAREMNRINNAGGFVNRFGRVNGNLNLSRSIGDLKYKQVPGIAPADQMITAQPDILQVTLNPKDEFFILGCDGIWDCLTNEKAVEFVRERIDTKEPKDIGEEMLNQILSDDPRATQGIGGDNMTILIVDLQPHTRSYKVDPEWGPPAQAAL